MLVSAFCSAEFVENTKKHLIVYLNIWPIGFVSYNKIGEIVSDISETATFLDFLLPTSSELFCPSFLFVSNVQLQILSVAEI